MFKRRPKLSLCQLQFNSLFEARRKYPPDCVRKGNGASLSNKFGILKRNLKPTVLGNRFDKKILDV